MIVPKLTDEMRRAIAAKSGGPIAVVDESTGDGYVVVSKDEYRRLNDEYIRSALQLSIDQVTRGEISELNMDELLAESHRRYAARIAET